MTSGSLIQEEDNGKTHPPLKKHEHLAYSTVRNGHLICQCNITISSSPTLRHPLQRPWQYSANYAA